ncbi:hypothetical protein BDZ91DRAFT_730504 [Kalaharituber pfeilii]|nr:hypothetical protein BDZ91DRAFT_730504 [Kalaharituber pfeilii]
MTGMLRSLRMIRTVAAIGVLSLAGQVLSLSLGQSWDVTLYEHVGYQGRVYTKSGSGVTLLSSCENLPPNFTNIASSMKWVTTGLLTTGLLKCSLTLYPTYDCKKTKFDLRFTDSVNIPSFLAFPYGATDTFNDKAKSFSVSCLNVDI